jgi:glucokinase
MLGVAFRRDKSERRFAIALDVGATSLRSAIVASDSSILKKTFRKTSVNSQGSAKSIIDTFIQFLRLQFKRSKDKGIEIMGIGIGMPGPFDYEKGIALLKDKFSAIYGINLRDELIRRLHENLLIKFENDAWTF